MVLQQCDYLFTSAPLLEAFDACLETMKREMSTQGAFSLNENVNTILVEAFDEDLSGTQKFAVPDAKAAVDTLEAIFSAFANEYVFPTPLFLEGRYLDCEGRLEPAVPICFHAGMFRVSDVSTDDLFHEISISYDAALDADMTAVHAAQGGQVFDAWNVIYSPLGVDDEVTEALEGAGIDPASFDHEGGETAEGRSYHDFYYRNNHDEEARAVQFTLDNWDAYLQSQCVGGNWFPGETPSPAAIKSAIAFYNQCH
jgi:hypothetical protein